MSAWGGSFGVAWGDSWGGAAPVVVRDTHDGFRKHKAEDSEHWRKREAKRLADIRAAVERVTGPIAQEIRREYPALHEAQSVDVEALSLDIDRVERLLEAYRDEDEFALLIHFF